MPYSLEREQVNSLQQIIKKGDTWARLATQKVKGNILDFGGEAIVIPLTDNPEIVFAMSRNNITPIEAKRLFYTQRLFSTLFPYHIPEFVTAWGSENKKAITGTMRRRIYDNTNGNLLSSSIDVVNFWEEVEEPRVFGRDLLDRNRKNYKFGPDGSEYYLDTITGLRLEISTIKNIFTWMDNHTIINPVTNEERGYTSEEKEQVLVAISKLRVLNQISVSEFRYWNKLWRTERANLKRIILP